MVAAMTMPMAVTMSVPVPMSSMSMIPGLVVTMPVRSVLIAIPFANIDRDTSLWPMRSMSNMDRHLGLVTGISVGNDQRRGQHLYHQHFSKTAHGRCPFISEFRRPCTLAKGADFCDFNFYRKGTAPPTEHLNK